MNEIIIDNIDVSGCRELTNYENVLLVCNETGRKCELNPNCCYKQLKRLEAENKLLKGTLKDKNFVAIVENNEKLEAENAKLKEENEKLNKMTGIFSARLCEKYRMTLQEIKAIAKNCVKGCIDCGLIAEPYECEDCTDGGMAKLGKKILDLITKAEEE